jgi:hypothetical protein
MGLLEEAMIMGRPDSPVGKEPLRPLRYNLELLSNLIYLARKSDFAQQQRDMDWADDVITEMRHHPKLYE